MMKTSHRALVAVLFLAVVTPVLGQRSLDRTETLEILKELTSDGPQTWIPSGTIIATHRQYRAPRTTDEAEINAAIRREIDDFEGLDPSRRRAGELEALKLEALPFNVRYKMANEYTMYSDVVLKYDGEKFHWSIDVSSRDDSVVPSDDLAANQMIEYFDLKWNARRVYAWDGQEYSICFASADNAIIDASNRFPRAVNGPLTAGLIRWGQGQLTYDNLSAAEISATEAVRDGITQIQISVEQTGASSMTFVLDPAKDYAATKWTYTRGDTVVCNYYAGHQQVAGRWVPTTILIESHDASTDRLLASDKWDLTSIDVDQPGPEQFKVEYTASSLIEYFSPLSAKSSTFRYSNMADTRRLLAERLAYTAAEGRQPQNCATAAVKYAAARLGRTVSDVALAPMVGRRGQTTMTDLKQSVQDLGLHSRAVKTDLATLKDLADCQAILHLPRRDHFVLLDHFEDNYVWLADLSNSKFLYRHEVNRLPADWSSGVALLLSDRPIVAQLDDIGDSTLDTIAGGDGWSCTAVIQENYVEYCWETLGDCGGYFTWFYLRYGCEQAPSGTCYDEAKPFYSQTECLWNPSSGCYAEGSWYSSYGGACD